MVREVATTAKVLSGCVGAGCGLGAGSGVNERRWGERDRDWCLVSLKRVVCGDLVSLLVEVGDWVWCLREALEGGGVVGRCVCRALVVVGGGVGDRRRAGRVR